MTKSYNDENRTTLSISISLPVNLNEPMLSAAARRGMTRSQYVTWLVRNQLYLEHGLLPGIETPPMPNVPPRIRRHHKNKKTT